MIDQVLLRRDHDHKAKTIKMKNRATKGKVPKGTSPSGTPNQPSCFSNLKGKCTKPSCNCWHPPECVKHKTNEGCQFWESVRFVSHNNEAPRNTSKKRTRHLKITILQFYACNPKLGCVISGRRITRTNGWTCERETVFCEEERQEISRERISNSNTRKLRKESSTFGNKWDFPLEVIQGGPKYHRNPNTPTFADRDPNNKLWAEDGARKAA